MEDPTDYGAWPIKELRRFLMERGQDPGGIVEKGELVAKVREAAKKMASSLAPAAPPGYVYDPASGYWYGEASGLFWDAKSGGFYSAESGKWFSWDGARHEFMEWKQAA